MAEPFTIYKLTILYMLSKAGFPLTNTQISNFFLSEEYTDYFRVQEVLGDLVDTNLIVAAVSYTHLDVYKRQAERCHSNIVSRRRFIITLIIFYLFCHIPSCRKLKVQIYASDVCLPSTWKRNVRIRTCNTNRLSVKISLIQSSIYEIYPIRVNHRY